MVKIIKWIEAEIIKIIPTVIYFAIAFNVLHFTTGLMLQPGTHRYFTYWSVTIAALIVGKVILIANYFKLMNAFPHKPLIYNILWKFFLYTLFVLVFKLIESFFTLTYRYHSTQLACQNIWDDLTSPIFWASFIGLALVFSVFVIFSEFTRVLGKPQVMKILFG